ncbi:unnamed protein product [Gongylonema pulchrum]|uniref:Tyrosine-protein phosphatase domain-containing protein n=1 Tax=Gongylonema pulchrum TaxID=637853 RepID=A0A183D1B8_9BILA|nr:unnamed protein product [Gongylonema pulchrum]
MVQEVFGFGVDGILQQYQTYLKTYIPPNFSHSAFLKHMNKNRYKDVLCLDHTRVVLQDKDPDADYIHANYVKGEPLINSFICTQAGHLFAFFGPMSVTVNDFWLMIVQERVSSIVMLCNVTEAGKNKCFQYWPAEAGSSLTFGG